MDKNVTSEMARQIAAYFISDSADDWDRIPAAEEMSEILRSLADQIDATSGIVNDRNEWRDQHQNLVAIHQGEQASHHKQMAELQAQLAATARCETLEMARDYFRGYEADLACIKKALDEVNAPHDCEDGVSLEPRRIRLLGAETDALRARVAGITKELEAEKDTTFRLIQECYAKRDTISD
jgi:hypothetical protein